MLTRLTLKDFQAWPALDLPLSPITVIVGETNAGKSSILRALGCVLYNALEGSAMVRDGAGKNGLAEVTLEVDGHRVEWARGAGVNRFTANGVVLDKPGRVVPPAVEALTGIKELEFDGEAVRLQWAPQMDAPFLLADAGAKATRMLGVAGKAAIVAQATKYAVQESREGVSAVNAAQAQTERLQAEVDKYAFVEAAEPLVTPVVERQKALVELRTRIEAVELLTARERVARQALRRIQRSLAAAEDLKRLHDLRTDTLQLHLLLQQYAETVARGERAVTKALSAERRYTLLHRQVLVLEAMQAVVQRNIAAGRCSTVAARAAVATRVLELRQAIMRGLEIRQTLIRHIQLGVTVSECAVRRADAVIAAHTQRVAHEALLASVTCPTCGAIRTK
jgi:exonuclease SbcC